MNNSSRAFIFMVKSLVETTNERSLIPTIIMESLISGDTLRTLDFDDNVISAGFLYNIISNTKYNIEDLSKLFGGDITSLIITSISCKSTDKFTRNKQFKLLKDLPIRNKAIIIVKAISNINRLILSYKQTGNINNYEETILYYKNLLETLEFGVEDEKLNSLLDLLYKKMLEIFNIKNQKKLEKKGKDKKSVKDNLAVLKETVNNEKPFIIKVVSDPTLSEETFLEVFQAFFEKDDFKIIIANETNQKGKLKYLNYNDRNTLISSEFESGFLTEISNGKDVIIISKDLFERILYLSVFLTSSSIKDNLEYYQAIIKGLGPVITIPRKNNLKNFSQEEISYHKPLNLIVESHRSDLDITA